MEEEKSLKEQLEETQQALKRAERQLEKSQSYNEELRQQIETLSAELHSYRSAVQNRVEAECQVEEKDIAEAYGDKPFPDWCSSGQSLEATEGQAESSTSIAESLKAAAEEEVWKEAGFVYDSTSGLYYNYNSGYYYDPARSLYYDPSTTSYFYYDEAEQTYKFHSYSSEQYSEQPAQSWDQGDVERTATQEGAEATQRAEAKHSSGREKRHRKHKHREQAKVQKRKALKTRRRTKSSKHKSKTKEKKKKAKDKDDAKDVADDRVIVVEDCDEGDKDENEEKGDDDHDDTKNAEVMEVESSDSLATGESEMESEPESGELTDQSSSSSSSEDDCVELAAGPVAYEHTAETVSEPELSASYPPCVRIVVQASDVVDVGTFFLVPCTGGTIGRDKDPRHVIQIQDINMSKVHAEIKYDSDNSCYTVEDLGSQNGTFVNDLRISECKERSAAIPLTHGDILQVASTRMLLHIHPGSETCDSCEPGQVLAALRAQQTIFNAHVVLTKEEKKQQARQEMKKIKKKYGLANSAYVDNVAALKNPDYADKADLRRRFVGSDHPSHKKRHETPASVHRPISSENKGHRMLAKMGWKEGSGLGKDSAGRAEPVNVELRANQTAGLGSTSSVGVSLDNVQSANKTRRLLQTQARYQRLENCGPHQSDNGTTHNASATSGKSVDDSRTQRGGSAVSLGKSSEKMQINWIRGETQKPP